MRRRIKNLSPAWADAVSANLLSGKESTVDTAENGLLPTFESLEQRTNFATRHIGPNAEDKVAMLKALGLKSMEAMVRKIVPAAILANKPLAMRKAMPEAEALRYLREIAMQNRVFKSFIGM